MTAIVPEQPLAVAPLLLRALDLVPRPAVPSWASDPDFVASVCAGLVDIPDEFNPEAS